LPSLEKLVLRDGRPTPSLWERAKDAVRSFTRGPYSSRNPDVAGLFGSGPTSAGVTVNDSTALTCAPFFAAVTMIAGDAATLPLHVYRRTSGSGKLRVPDHPVYDLLDDTPNAEMTAASMREAWILSALIAGTGYAEIERDQASRPMGVWPIPSHHVSPFRNERNRLQYRVRNPSGNEVIFEPRDLLVLHGPSLDGVMGFDTIRVMREALACRWPARPSVPRSSATARCSAAP